MVILYSFIVMGFATKIIKSLITYVFFDIEFMV